LDPEGSHLYLFRILSATSSQHIHRFAGVRFKTSYVSNTLQKSVTVASKSTLSSRPVFAVLEAGRQILSTPGWAERAESRTSLAPLLPLWEIEGAYGGTTVEKIARGQFQRGLLTSLLALAAIGVAAFATFTMAVRETRLARMKSAFVANISHEMKTPLALISMYTQTLGNGNVSAPEKVRDYYRIILRECAKLTGMVENVLDFARLEAGGSQMKFERINLGELTADVVHNLEERLQIGGFHWSLDVEPDLPRIEGDRLALSQALLNLLDNAMKYSADTKEIRIAVRRAASTVLVEITDRGIGISASEQHHVFEHFYRTGDPMTQNVRGAGIGLALVQHIVAAHRGRVELRSTPGSGSAFSLVFPVQTPST
jgi:signal transduction histidine kinase